MPFWLVVVLALVLTAALVWMWNSTRMKYFVPCQHKCGASVAARVFATLFFVSHFLPEAIISMETIKSNSIWVVFLGTMGFSLHGILDLYGSILLSSTWQKRWQQVVSFICIACCYFAAHWMAMKSLQAPIPVWVIEVGSIFFLSMLIHTPHNHKPSHSGGL